MKPLNQKAQKVFDKIISDLDTGKTHKTIDNCDTAFMPLHVEKLGTSEVGTTYSFCHYFKQNGDMCQDPEMLFIKHKSGRVFPSMFQMAIPPIYEESIFYDYGWKCRTRLQRQHKDFANMWLKNIKEQQRL